MEPIFQSHTVQTKETLREIAGRLMRGRLVAYAIVVCGLSAGFMIFTLVRQRQDALPFAMMFFFACLGLSIYRGESVPRKYAEQKYSENLKHYQETITTIVSLYETSVVCENLQTRLTHRYGYEELDKRMWESKHLLLLRTKEKSMVTIDKTAVGADQVPALRQFLREKLGIRGSSFTAASS